jgi:hypothetical protein
VRAALKAIGEEAGRALDPPGAVNSCRFWANVRPANPERARGRDRHVVAVEAFSFAADGVLNRGRNLVLLGVLTRWSII